MTVEYEEDVVKIIEEPNTLHLYAIGILLIVISSILFWVQRFTTAATDTILVGISSGGLLISLGFFGFAITRQKRVFSFTPAMVQIQDRSSGTKVMELPKSVISRIEKHLIYNREEPNDASMEKLREIIYDIEYEGKQMSFRYSTSHVNPLEESVNLDNFLKQNYNVSIDIDEVK